jgi:hypothetical protein
MKLLGKVSQNEHFPSRVFGDFLRIIIGYFIKYNVNGYGLELYVLKEWKLQQLREGLLTAHF